MRPEDLQGEARSVYESWRGLGHTEAQAMAECVRAGLVDEAAEDRLLDELGLPYAQRRAVGLARVRLTEATTVTDAGVDATVAAAFRGGDVPRRALSLEEARDELRSAASFGRRLPELTVALPAAEYDEVTERLREAAGGKRRPRATSTRPKQRSSFTQRQSVAPWVARRDELVEAGVPAEEARSRAVEETAAETDAWRRGGSVVSSRPKPAPAKAAAATETEVDDIIAGAFGRKTVPIQEAGK